MLNTYTLYIQPSNTFIMYMCSMRVCVYADVIDLDNGCVVVSDTTLCTATVNIII